MKQTEMFIERLNEKFPSIEPEVVVISTGGDLDLTTPLEGMGGFGAFVRELNNALLMGEVDITVNSLKDMPVLPQEGIAVPSVLPRGPVEDVIIPCPLALLPSGAKIGTSSVRRAAMIRNLRPDLVPVTIRGNVNTRVRKLEEGLYDAIILASAGVQRLSLEVESHPLDCDHFTPAPGQGAIGMACRSDDEHALRILEAVNHVPTMHAVNLERRLMRMMGADCSAPVGILVTESGQGHRLRALSVTLDGRDKRCLDMQFDNVDETWLEQVSGYLKEVF